MHVRICQLIDFGIAVKVLSLTIRIFRWVELKVDYYHLHGTEGRPCARAQAKVGQSRQTESRQLRVVRSINTR